MINLSSFTSENILKIVVAALGVSESLAVIARIVQPSGKIAGIIDAGIVCIMKIAKIFNLPVPPASGK